MAIAAPAAERRHAHGTLLAVGVLLSAGCGGDNDTPSAGADEGEARLESAQAEAVQADRGIFGADACAAPAPPPLPVPGADPALPDVEPPAMAEPDVPPADPDIPPLGLGRPER